MHTRIKNGRVGKKAVTVEKTSKKWGYFKLLIFHEQTTSVPGRGTLLIALYAILSKEQDPHDELLTLGKRAFHVLQVIPN